MDITTNCDRAVYSVDILLSKKNFFGLFTKRADLFLALIPFEGNFTSSSSSFSAFLSRAICASRSL